MNKTKVNNKIKLKIKKISTKYVKQKTYKKLVNFTKTTNLLK
jgi:hypothetical protein